MFIYNLCIPGECCVALRSQSGTLEHFETFLSHRGEEMGSIRGQVKVHVPADYRRAARSKIYGWSTRANGLPQLSLHSFTFCYTSSYSFFL